MDIFDRLLSWLSRIDPRLVARLEPRLKTLPAVRAKLDQEYDEITREAEPGLKPYRDEFPSCAELPETGRDRDEILREMEALRAREQARWQDGFVSGAVYHGDPEHVEFLNRVYALHSQSNPLHFDVWPSATKFEAEIVAMAASILTPHPLPPPPAQSGGRGLGEVCGTVTSGGTESILLAMKAYRDWGRERRGITRPEMVVPVTAHVAFDKAAQYLGIKLVHIPVGADCRADVGAARRAITRNTVVVAGSAPSFPHGAIDPIEELSELARERGSGFHTDACLGGFVLPFARELGYPAPPFDFSLPGVTSMSIDTHKYGYAAKGTSVVLYRGLELRHYQYFTATDWPGGLYFSPTMAGSRPGGLSAACWASMMALGRQGYRDAARRILETGATIRRGVEAIPELRVLGDPLWVIAFMSPVVNIYRVMDAMTARGWSLNGLHRPSAVHLAVTLRHAQPGVAERFLTDLRAAVDEARAHPEADHGMAPVYGMAATLPLRSVVGDILKRYIDLLYKI